MDIIKGKGVGQRVLGGGLTARGFGSDPLIQALRAGLRQFVEGLLIEEAKAVIGADVYERTPGRKGYRNGSLPRTLTTSLGPVSFDRPRVVLSEGGPPVEFQSHFLERYRRRAREVDTAVLGLYLGGVNTRKIKKALRPLLKNAPLSKSSVSRLIQRLKEAFEGWRSMGLDKLAVRYVYLDGLFVKARCGGKVHRLPVLAVLGVTADGRKVLLALETRGGEGKEAWKGVLDGLVARGLRKPRLLVVDGGAGLLAATSEVWPGVPRQRCAVHKLRNLLSHAPQALHDEIRDDFHAIVYGENKELAKAAYQTMARKWRKMSEGVAKSLEEAGEELLTFFDFPESQWKSIRTTNAIERLNGEFRRRTKSQVLFPTEGSVLVMLFGLVASGMVRLRRMEGWKDMAQAGDMRPGPGGGATQEPLVLAA
jgi:transposase-like protein